LNFRHAQVSIGGPVTVDRQFVKLRTTALLAVSSTVTTDDFVIEANSAFDPFQAEATLQPQGFDQWAALYEKYRVWKCRLKVTPFPNNLTMINGFYVVFPSNDSTAITNDSNALSHPFAKWKVINGVGSNPITTPQTIVMNMSTEKISGVSRIDTNFSTAAAISGNPSAPWFYHIFSGAGSGNLTTEYIVEIEQDVEFFERFEVADAESMMARFEENKKKLSLRTPLNKHKVYAGLGAGRNAESEREYIDLGDEKAISKPVSLNRISGGEKTLKNLHVNTTPSSRSLK
jgi:hypothetical protein